VSAAPWAAHFGLARTPFGKSIPARDLFARQAHAEAIARIGFCVVESALGVVTGDVGAGKTVALRAAVAGLDPTRHQVIYIANPAFGTRGLYVTIVRALGAQPRYLKAELMAQAGDLLAAETAERHRRVVVIVDEAHLLEPAQLEELRLLTNAEMDSASPFAGILAGQPTLNRQLRMGMFAAPGQRIATRFTIKPMDLAESAAYLRHHLALAGREEPLLTERCDRPAAPRRQRAAPPGSSGVLPRRSPLRTEHARSRALGPSKPHGRSDAVFLGALCLCRLAALAGRVSEEGLPVGGGRVTVGQVLPLQRHTGDPQEPVLPAFRRLRWFCGAQ
jgi:type II secretory pathway predicted ATPase ExeA